MRIFVSLLIAGLLHGEGVTPKAKPSDYPAQAPLGRLTLAADNLVHSIPTAGGSYLTTDYLVIEVAVYGSHLSHVSFAANQFQLRINGAKHPLAATPYIFAIQSIKHPESPSPTLETGIGDRSVIFGGPSREPRFPGDPRAGRAPRAPKAPNATGKEVDQPLSMDELIADTVFPEGDHVPPIAGILFFPFQGKIKSIRSLELLYAGPHGEAVVKLQ